MRPRPGSPSVDPRHPLSAGLRFASVSGVLLHPFSLRAQGDPGYVFKVDDGWVQSDFFTSSQYYDWHPFRDLTTGDFPYSMLVVGRNWAYQGSSYVAIAASGAGGAGYAAIWNADFSIIARAGSPANTAAFYSAGDFPGYGAMDPWVLGLTYDGSGLGAGISAYWNGQLVTPSSTTDAVSMFDIPPTLGVRQGVATISDNQLIAFWRRQISAREMRTLAEDPFTFLRGSSRRRSVVALFAGSAPQTLTGTAGTVTVSAPTATAAAGGATVAATAGTVTVSPAAATVAATATLTATAASVACGSPAGAVVAPGGVTLTGTSPAVTCSAAAATLTPTTTLAASSPTVTTSALTPSLVPGVAVIVATAATVTMSAAGNIAGANTTLPADAGEVDVSTPVGDVSSIVRLGSGAPIVSVSTQTGTVIGGSSTMHAIAATVTITAPPVILSGGGEAAVYLAEDVVAERLLEVEAVTAIVAERVHLQVLPQSARLPAIVVQAIGEPSEYHLRGGSKVIRARVQVDLYDREEFGATNPYTTLEALYKAMAGDRAGSALDGFRGTIAAWPDAPVLGLFQIDRSPDFLPEEKRQVRMRIDYRVIFRERE